VGVGLAELGIGAALEDVAGGCDVVVLVFVLLAFEVADLGAGLVAVLGAAALDVGPAPEVLAPSDGVRPAAWPAPDTLDVQLLSVAVKITTATMADTTDFLRFIGLSCCTSVVRRHWGRSALRFRR
jgi:hypothetical protein